MLFFFFFFLDCAGGCKTINSHWESIYLRKPESADQEPLHRVAQVDQSIAAIEPPRILEHKSWDWRGRNRALQGCCTASGREGRLNTDADESAWRPRRVYQGVWVNLYNTVTPASSFCDTSLYVYIVKTGEEQRNGFNHGTVSKQNWIVLC